MSCDGYKSHLFDFRLIRYIFQGKAEMKYTVSARWEIYMAYIVNYTVYMKHVHVDFRNTATQFQVLAFKAVRKFVDHVDRLLLKQLWINKWNTHNMIITTWTEWRVKPQVVSYKLSLTLIIQIWYTYLEITLEFYSLFRDWWSFVCADLFLIKPQDGATF